MWHPHMGLCTGLTLGCLTVATPSALAQMLTRRQTWSCHLSNLWGSGDATPSLDAAPACQAGPTPTSPLPTRSTRIQKPVSGDSASSSRNASSYYSTLIFLRFCVGFFFNRIACKHSSNSPILWPFVLSYRVFVNKLLEKLLLIYHSDRDH